MTARFVALVAGIGFFFLAVITQGILPLLEPTARTSKVTSVVRTDFGQLKWMVADATDYTPTQQLGRSVYLREGCWYCHSQYVRPVTGETRRWGPVTEAGEYAYDVPHLFGTRRIGPDLMRVGLKYGDEWHIAHFWNARMLSPDSIMAPYRGLFEQPKAPVAIVDDGSGNKTLEKTPVTQRLFDYDSKEQIKLTPNADGLLFVPLEARRKSPIILTPNKEYTGNSVTIAAETRELQSLVAYLQKLGMNRGKWRDVFEPQQLEIMDVTLPRSEEWIAYGKEVYERRCVGCHGKNGDGNGPAATFMYKQRPRSFAAAVFKFRLTKEPLPSCRWQTASPSFSTSSTSWRWTAPIQQSLMRSSKRSRPARPCISDGHRPRRRSSSRAPRMCGRTQNVGNAMAKPAAATGKRRRVLRMISASRSSPRI